MAAKSGVETLRSNRYRKSITIASMRGTKVPQLDAIKRKESMTQPDIIQITLSRNRAKDLLEYAKRAVEIA